ncbi:MAG TPA: hypothetical protein VK135_08385 [Candidatus Dormibacteraeota bacterium]|nr:hypothetical protein [Candidatus Dormibacteraeota bacterium]
MNRKTIIILSIGLLIVTITLIIQNQQLKAEKEQLRGDIKEVESQLQDKKQAADTTEVYLEARSAAESFITTYFQFTNQPNKDEVLPLVSSSVEDKLSFQDEVQSNDNFSDIVTKVNNLEIFFGEKTDKRQEIFARFKSEIDVDGTKTESPSFVKLDMINNDNGWIVDNMEFMQY